MNLGGRIQAAIEVLTDIETRYRPAADALRDWGRAHRFAGSGDRAVIGNLVFDVLRNRSSLAAWLLDDTPRMAVFGVLVRHWRKPVGEVAMACALPHGPDAISEHEADRLGKADVHNHPDHVSGDYPHWLDEEMRRVFGEARVDEGRALCKRPPVDLRVNTLKAQPPKVAQALKAIGAEPGTLAPSALRIPAPPAEQRYPNVENETAHGKGWFEVQDQGSQVAALLANATPGAQVLDLCAGAGGKTLALAAAMENRGQIHAYDTDAARLRRIFPRLKRAGVRNAQVIEARDRDRLAGLDGQMDLVFVDAPCSGSGTWRRRPDAKWRLTPEALERRRAEQRQVLRDAAPKVKPGGRLVYVTCSVLTLENDDQIGLFMTESARDQGFEICDVRTAWEAALSVPFVDEAATRHGALLTPLRHGTDGFYISILERGNAA